MLKKLLFLIFALSLMSVHSSALKKDVDIRALLELGTPRTPLTLALRDTATIMAAIIAGYAIPRFFSSEKTITKKVIKGLVVVPGGQVYNENLLKEWLRTNQNKDPLTRTTIPSDKIKRATMDDLKGPDGSWLYRRNKTDNPITDADSNPLDDESEAKKVYDAGGDVFFCVISQGYEPIKYRETQWTERHSIFDQKQQALGTTVGLASTLLTLLAVPYLHSYHSSQKKIESILQKWDEIKEHMPEKLRLVFDPLAKEYHEGGGKSPLTQEQATKLVYHLDAYAKEENSATLKQGLSGFSHGQFIIGIALALAGALTPLKTIVGNLLEKNKRISEKTDFGLTYLFGIDKAEVPFRLLSIAIATFALSYMWNFNRLITNEINDFMRNWKDLYQRYTPEVFTKPFDQLHQKFVRQGKIPHDALSPKQLSLMFKNMHLIKMLCIANLPQQEPS